MADEYDYLFKCIVVGDGGVGKTALTIRFSKGFFTEDYKMTIGVDFHVKTINIDTEEEGPIKVKLQIWDTGGQERFSSIRPMYYRGSLGGLLIFDLTSYESFEHLPQWIEEVRANVKAEIPLLLVGNKSDLLEERSLSIEEINNFTNKFNLYYMETSAKTGDGVGDCFYILACLMVGSGVPEKLISQGIVYGPGYAISAASEIPTEIISDSKIISPALEPEPQSEFIAPPVPEPVKTFEPEPEIDFAAPPVPEPVKTFEPEPEIDFAAPPVPEPVKIFEPEPEIDFTTPPVPEPSKTIEPEIPIPQPMSSPQPKDTMEFEFKTPEQILSEEATKLETEPPFFVSSKFSVSSESPVYKPKAIPFTSNIPIPAPAPEEFKDSESKSEADSESLVDYMAETILSKKERKKLEKQRKKEEKERKLQEKREKAAKLKEKMQSVGKEEKEKPKTEKKKKKEEEVVIFEEKLQDKGKTSKLKGKETETKPFVPFQTESPKERKSGVPDLFQTLSQKTETQPPSQSSPFIPFKPAKTSDKQESSNLRIIPNVADVESKISSNSSQPPIFSTSTQPSVPEAPSIPTIQREEQSSRKKDVIICSYCGAMLSSDYAFCNKCGAKLS
ncbi:MAG: GTP-binding protein [Promethearchaeota archaeon]|nr:MAG: GTP-binding protein [Candidatus Lokiarchaeota archaeon]